MKNQHNKKKFAMIAMILAGVLALVGCGADKIAENEKYMKDDTEVVETVEEVKLTDYVVGLHDWTVEVNSENIDFMKDVEYNKEVVKEVKVDSTKVDLGKEGKYDLVYTIVPVDKSISDVDVTKKVTVKVVSVEEAQKEANAGKQVAVSNGEVKKDSNGKTPVAPPKEEPRKDVPVQKPVTDNKKPAGNTGSNSNSNKPAEQPSQKPDNNKPADKPVEKPAAPSKPAEPSKPAPTEPAKPVEPSKPAGCQHNWVDHYDKIHHEAVYKDKPVYAYDYECKVCHQHFNDVKKCVSHCLHECDSTYQYNEWIDHYEKELVTEASDELVKNGKDCTICGEHKN